MKHFLALELSSKEVCIIYLLSSKLIIFQYQPKNEVSATESIIFLT